MTSSELADRTARAVHDLCAWAAEATGPLPPAVLRRAALVLVDDIAAMLAARDEPEVAAIHAQQRARSARPEATLFDGRGSRVDRIAAAVGNAAACDWCELDEGYRPAMCHAGLYVLPALLAEAEARGLDIGEVLRCLVVGYEVATRFAHGFPSAVGLYHSHSTFCAIGAAAGIAAARRYPADRFHAAITSAVTLVAPGPFNHVTQGALVRNVWPAQGAWSGIAACDWAECGIAGLASSPWNVFVECLRCSAEPDAFTRGLGQQWGIEGGYHKMHACCQYVHSTVDASQALLRRLPPERKPTDVVRITVETHERAVALTNAEPETTLAAKFSVPHAAAAMAARGSADAPSFFADTLGDPTIAHLRRLVQVAPFGRTLPPPHDRPARVTWSFADGFTLTEECLSARGGPDQPYSGGEVLAKIERITGAIYPGFAAEAARFVDAPEAALGTPLSCLLGALSR